MFPPRPLRPWKIDGAKSGSGGYEPTETLPDITRVETLIVDNFLADQISQKRLESRLYATNANGILLETKYAIKNTLTGCLSNKRVICI